jgi:hypothetical protein
MVRRVAGLVIATLGLAMMVAPALAHHARAFVDTTKLISLEGVVTKLDWRNPHMWVYLDVPDQNGKMVNWAIEGPSSTSLLDFGLSPVVLKVGQKVIIRANPPRDPKDHRASLEQVIVNGKTYLTRWGNITRDRERDAQGNIK